MSERVGDVPLLAKHFLNRFAAELKRPVYEFNEETLHALQRYRWPGNVRELENVVERAVVLCKGRSIALSDLPETRPRSRRRPARPSVPPHAPARCGWRNPKGESSRPPSRANDWNRQLTAEQLQINRTTLYKKMKRLRPGPPPQPHSHPLARRLLESRLQDPYRDRQRAADSNLVDSTFGQVFAPAFTIIAARPGGPPGPVSYKAPLSDGFVWFFACATMYPTFKARAGSGST